MALEPKAVRKLQRTTLAAGEPNKVKQAVRLSGKTQGEVAADLGFTDSYFSNVVRGKFEDIGLTNARKIADYFGCAIDDLFPAKAVA